ncbi:myb-related protein A isoform X2 [Brachyhypopomus gauderio]
MLGKVKWSREEDERLKKLVEHHGTDAWRLIANFFPTRTDGQCQHRWQKVLNPELVKGPWTKEEDQRVIELVHKYGPKRWSVIAKHLQGRIGKQCRERWHNHLNPEVKKSSWTQEEDRIIYEAHKRLGNRWAEISKLLPGRTDNSIKNHWNSTMRRKVEQEGYLQENSSGFCTEQPPKRRHKVCPPAEHLHGHSQLLINGQSQLAEYSYGSVNGQCVDSTNEGSSFVSPCHDDPDKEQRIKELELLLMSAENEVRRRSGPRNPENYSGWNDSMADDTMATTGSLEEGGVARCRVGGACTPSAPLHISPSKFLAVEASAVLSTLHTIPEFAETMELIDSDPMSWSEVASFDLSEAVSPPKTPSIAEAYPAPEEVTEDMDYRHLGGPAGPELGRPQVVVGQGRPVHHHTPSTSKFGTSPPNIPRKKTRETGGRSLADARVCVPYTENGGSSPKGTPVKGLPFSPSQFFNISGAEHLNLEHPSLTSTPVCGHKCFLGTPHQRETTPKHQKENAGFRTPKIRKSIMCHAPRTPTPFKNALAAQEKMHGPLKIVPQPLAFLEEDIREVLKEETGADLFTQTQVLPERRPSEADVPSRKVRKSLLLDSWGKDCLNVQLFPQQRISSNEQCHNDGLLSSALLMIPLAEEEELACSSGPMKDDSQPPNCSLSPQAKKELHTHRSTAFQTSTQLPPQLSSEWEAVVFGKTEDQLIMTEQARRYLNSQHPSCTSRALVL